MIKKIRIIAAIVVAAVGLVIAASNFVLRKNRVDVTETAVSMRSSQTDITRN